MDDAEAVAKAIKKSRPTLFESAPLEYLSLTAQAAIDTLKSRGWTPPKEKP